MIVDLRVANIYVKDKSDGKIHRVGDSYHDTLYVDESGGIHYYNLQNGEGTKGDYEFVCQDNYIDEKGIEFKYTNDLINDYDN